MVSPWKGNTANSYQPQSCFQVGVVKRITYPASTQDRSSNPEQHAAPVIPTQLMCQKEFPHWSVKPKRLGAANPYSSPQYPLIEQDVTCHSGKSSPSSSAMTRSPSQGNLHAIRKRSSIPLPQVTFFL